MADLAHYRGGDLAVGASGDLLVAAGTAGGEQRVLRRLLTNQGDYIWHLNYGAGLPQFVGATANRLQIAAAIRSQVFAEAAVARTPEPAIDVSVAPGGAVYVQLRYVDAPSGQSQMLSFTVGP